MRDIIGIQTEKTSKKMGILRISSHFYGADFRGSLTAARKLIASVEEGRVQSREESLS